MDESSLLLGFPLQLLFHKGGGGGPGSNGLSPLSAHTCDMSLCLLTDLLQEEEEEVVVRCTGD